ncbi:hypothetical protein [Paludibaculum fermentans]|uniref:hypothetical protein n=1 Tax=Paludibaculum fermentans TaxID=1473598 RepID=UPI003EC0FF01
MLPLLEQSLAAMGGRSRLEAIQSLHIKGFGHYYLIEQSERPAGPWIVRYEQTEEWRDLVNGRRRVDRIERPGQVDRQATISGDGLQATLMTVQGREFPPRVMPADTEWLDLSPQRVLLTALAASDLRTDGSTLYQEVMHHAAAFTWQGFPVRILFNADTALPTVVELVRTYPRDTFWNVWGDVTTRWIYSYWYLEQGGLHYPRQVDIEKGGYAYRSFSIDEMTINAAVPAERLALPPDAGQLALKAQPEVEALPLGRPDRPAVELAPGFVKVPGNWDIAYIRQDDGLLILEAPISAGYSQRVLEEAARRFPDTPVKAVISTSDAWPHFSGVREYVARGIPVYLLDRNEPIVRRLLSAPRSLRPDALATRRREPDLRLVASRTLLGSGANRVELIPLRTETGERMMMAWFPEHRILYASDLVQGPMPDGSFFMPQYLSEVRDAAAREKIQPESVFAMHAPKTSWSKILAAIDVV